ncbi:clpB [Mytilus edulis]|uniref:ClpB n=1 Tax=Mytilus edulis TaxID=6550 RepID=A0A8S3U2J1_MYTED|nr:clpB [Mytilus edulis]
MLVVSSLEKSTIVNLNDMSQTILEEVVAYYVALFKGNIYGTDSSENKVCCYKSSGEPLWSFIPDATDSPRGITLDKNGFVYVVSKYNNRVVVVSPDGKTCKTILSEADGIKSLIAIDIDRESGMMIVSSTIRDDDDDREYYTAFCLSTLKYVILIQKKYVPGADPTIENKNGHKPVDYVKSENVSQVLHNAENKFNEVKEAKEAEERRKFPLEQRLKQFIIGQEGAINTVAAGNYTIP